MGDPKGFIKVARKEGGYRALAERVEDYSEVEQTLGEADRQLQASRCMDCGVPFCHWACPLGNKTPEWQDAAWRSDWETAYKILNSTSNFPEFTGRICPALCEKSCVLAIDNEAVTIRENECAVAEHAFNLGIVKPRIPSKRTGKKVAVIGGGPAGMAVADMLNQAGHAVTVFEKSNAIGGLLRYGIPDFKLSKKVIDRRLAIMQAEGITFKTGTEVGVNTKLDKIRKDFDAIVVTIGAGQPRDLKVEGRELEGIHFALDFLQQQNHVNRGDVVKDDQRILATGKPVLVIGGGDTGSDCVGTSNRQKARSVMQIEIMPKPSETRAPGNPWPYWPNVLKTTSSHKEGCDRRWCLNTKRFIGEGGKVKKVELVEVEWAKDASGRWQMTEKPDTAYTVDAELVLLCMGFVSPVHEGLVNELGVELDARGNIKVGPDGMTSVPGVFAAGDAATGASLVVRAIARGRETAQGVHEWLMKDAAQK
ncbi:MAG: glutamate synthase subunit beta [Bacteroidales bacterium]|nr:glutamate synthase subunit beta [Bacteroidales bacterium]MDY4174950.1 glutamate synthase subunit beta [Bacteroidales bacterium]